jgi:hypothetical protein
MAPPGTCLLYDGTFSHRTPNFLAGAPRTLPVQSVCISPTRRRLSTAPPLVRLAALHFMYSPLPIGSLPGKFFSLILPLFPFASRAVAFTLRDLDLP